MANNETSAIYRDLRKATNTLVHNIDKYNDPRLWEDVDVTLPENCFDYQRFMGWWRTEVDRLHEYEDGEIMHHLEASIVCYMNKSICYIQGTNKGSYYMLKMHPVVKTTYWSPVVLETFRSTFMGYSVKLPKQDKKSGETVMANKSLFDIYTQSPYRRVHCDTCFDPPVDGKPVDTNFLNLWTGYRWSPSQMEAAAQSREAQEVAIDFFKFMFEIHCQGSVSMFTYVMDWLAKKMRSPGTKMSTTITFYSSAQRVGKGWFINKIGHLFGKHYATTTRASDLTGQFTNYVDNLVLLFLDEVRNVLGAVLFSLPSIRLVDTRSSDRTCCRDVFTAHVKKQNFMGGRELVSNPYFKGILLRGQVASLGTQGRGHRNLQAFRSQVR